MPIREFDKEVEAAEAHISTANSLLDNPESGSAERAQTEATLATAHALLAIADAIRHK
jgi:hypothetical protein